MKKYTNSWFKGWNRDRAKDKYGNENYYYAENLRLNDKTAGSTFDLTNIDGNNLTNFISSDYRIYMYTVLRTHIYVLAIHSLKTDVADLSHSDKLFKFNIAINGDLDMLDYTGMLTSQALYTGDLGLNPNSTNKKIIGRYESPLIEKIYWTSGENIRFANVAINLSSYTSTKFNIIPSALPGLITINSIGLGTLKSGVVQYAYQLYNLNGATTSFITISDLVPLSLSSQSILPDTDFLGSPLEENANKSVTFTITNIDSTNFNRIKLVRIFYSTLFLEPIITYIADLNNSSTLSYIDTGSDNLGSLTLDEFNFINYQFNCSTLEIKNNILFAGGITEQTYTPISPITSLEWDSRAYRFNAYGSCTVYDALGGSPLFFSTGAWYDVPLTHDCYNKIYNSIPKLVTGPIDNFKYKSDGSTEGAEGPNIVISIAEKGIYLDTNLNSVQFNVSDIDRNSNATQNSLNSFYQRDEIYAFAIELINNKGQRSPAKWICDFRMPEFINSGLSTQYSQSLIGTGLSLYVSVKNLPSDCIGYRILRCERTAQDRTILAQGILDCAITSTNPTNDPSRPGTTLVSIKEYKDTTNNWHLMNSNIKLDRTILQLYSPEINFNKDIKYIPGDFIEIIGYATRNKHFVKNTQPGIYNVVPATYNYSPSTNISIKKLTYIGSLPKQSISILAGVLVTPPPYKSANIGDKQFSVSIGGRDYVNSSFYYGTNNTAKGNTKFVVKTADTITNISSVSDTIGNGVNYMFFNYRRPTIQYGGNSYQNRINRTYIPCTRFLRADDAPYYNAHVINGDTVIDYFECTRSMVNGLDNEVVAGYLSNENLFETICFPVETSIHVKWANYTTFNKNAYINNAWLTQETAGLKTKVIGTITYKYEQTKDLYSYNSVYSISNKVTTIYPKNDLVSPNKSFDARIQWSERKFNNELIDSWTIWKPLNFKDVDNQYGAIQNLVNYNTRLLFFQPTGVGVLSVDERELTSGTNSSQLILGTGSVGQRYDYISTACGTIHPDSIQAGKVGLFWYDRYNNSFFVYEPTGNIDNVTKLSGIQSYLHENITEGTYLTNVITGYDPKYNEVLFTFRTPNNWGFNRKTIVYNELGKYFVGTFSFEPQLYINVPNFYYSSNNLHDIYKHNITVIEKCNFYGLTYYSKLETIINPEGSEVVRFDILEWNSECIDILGEHYNTTFRRIGANTDYTNLSNMAYMGIDTGTILLNPTTNMIQRFRNYRFNQLRDVTSSERMKDYYLKVTLFYDNTLVTTAAFKIHNLTTTYEHTAPY